MIGFSRRALRDGRRWRVLTLEHDLVSNDNKRLA